MDVLNLCKKIELQTEIRDKVLTFTKDFDFGRIKNYLSDFCIYEKMNDAYSSIRSVLGKDEDNIKILACMLKASADVYDIYKEKGISDDIYFATMKCYTRFIDETYKITGKLYFDRYWWTARQAGGHLFRVGELEYEIKTINNNKVIGIHIPSDADFSKDAIDKSFEQAKRFFEKYYPELRGCEWRCHSWLLDDLLQNMLESDSNIISFQKRFEIFDKGEADTEFIEWLFQSRTKDYKSLPEKTSLQRKMKIHILAGGVVRNAYGRLKVNPKYKY